MYAEAKSDVLHAIQLSPRDPNLGVWQSTLTASDIGLGHFDDAIDNSHRAIDAGYRTLPVYSNLAVACAMSNRVDDARAAVAEALKLNPKYSVKLMSERYHKPPVILEALRKAGRRRSDRGSSQRHCLGEWLLSPQSRPAPRQFAMAG
jgi:tetratricopeptide (TPR) repeat protein